MSFLLYVRLLNVRLLCFSYYTSALLYVRLLYVFLIIRPPWYMSVFLYVHLVILPLLTDTNKVKMLIFCINSDKVTAIPIQVWTDPEGSRKLKFPDFKTVST